MNFKRIFIAAPLSENLRNEIKIWRKKYERLPVRWLEDKNLHITIIPPWYEKDTENIKNICKQVKGKAFDAVFEEIEFGPDLRRPRLIWAEGETPPEIISLKLELEEKLHKQPEKRPFRLHLTLARFRPETFSSFSIKRLKEKIYWRDKISSFNLLEAHLSREGADYAILEEFPLL